MALQVPAHILAQVQERVVEAVEVVWRRSQPVQGEMQQGAVEAEARKLFDYYFKVTDKDEDLQAQLVPPTRPVLALVLAQEEVWEEVVHHQMTSRLPRAAAGLGTMPLYSGLPLPPLVSWPEPDAHSMSTSSRLWSDRQGRSTSLR